MYAATIDAVNEAPGTITRDGERFAPAATTYPHPSGVRDTRAYEAQWADAPGGGELPDGAEAALQQQAETVAQATLVDAYRAAMADVAARFPGWYAHGLYSMPFGPYSPACWQVIVSKGGEQHHGTGETIGAAVEDLLAQVAGGVAA
jgi:hypothetical protein